VTNSVARFFELKIRVTIGFVAPDVLFCSKYFFAGRMSDIARDAVFVPTGELPMENPVTVEGYDFDEGVDYDKLFR